MAKVGRKPLPPETGTPEEKAVKWHKLAMKYAFRSPIRYGMPRQFQDLVESAGNLGLWNACITPVPKGVTWLTHLRYHVHQQVRQIARDCANSPYKGLSSDGKETPRTYSIEVLSEHQAEYLFEDGSEYVGWEIEAEEEVVAIAEEMAKEAARRVKDAVLCRFLNASSEATQSGVVIREANKAIREYVGAVA